LSSPLPHLHLFVDVTTATSCLICRVHSSAIFSETFDLDPKGIAMRLVANTYSSTEYGHLIKMLKDERIADHDWMAHFADADGVLGLFSTLKQALAQRVGSEWHDNMSKWMMVKQWVKAKPGVQMAGAVKAFFDNECVMILH
jgi:hypothetical protein